MKVEIKNQQYMSIAPIVIIGTNYEKVNFTTVGDIAIMGINPPLLAVGLHKNHFATKEIFASKILSINIPSIDDLELVKLCSTTSGHQVDKSSYCEYDLIDNMPIIQSTPISMVADVVDYLKYEQRCIFLVKIIRTFVEEDLKHDPQQINPILYGLNDQFYKLGNEIK